MVYIIGVTGGIASGKSSLCGILQDLVKQEDTLTVVVIDCDKLGHRAYEKDTPCYHKIVEYFGPTIVSEDGEINRRAMGGIVFSDPKEMRALEAMVWPAIRGFIESEIETIKASDKAESTVVIMEAAVMLESGWTNLCDTLLLTYIEKSLACSRLMARNNFTDEEANKRINSQMTNNERFVKLRENDIKIENNGTTEDLQMKANEFFTSVILPKMSS
jgi:phosphopantetheine adenylyltransferase / dephospho-CoA kinase